uniref:Putative secreted protein n=1 Tax=Panstrongylus lignarius TaxID=156445 RepID=A0A224XU64_9HEMI
MLKIFFKIILYSHTFLFSVTAVVLVSCHYLSFPQKVCFEVKHGVCAYINCNLKLILAKGYLKILFDLTNCK